MNDNPVPVATYAQYRRIRRLVHECCNYDHGNCIALDDGYEPCVCVQSISYSLLCKWFRAAVLPLDKELCAALLPKPAGRAADLPRVRQALFAAQAQYPLLPQMRRRPGETQPPGVGAEKQG